MRRMVLTIFGGLLLQSTTLRAQESLSERLKDLGQKLEYKTEVQTTNSGGDFAPLWLNANKFGLSSVERNNGYLRGALYRPIATDSTRKWGIGYGVDMAVAHHFTSTFVMQQLYADFRYRHVQLSVGSKEYPMEFKNNELSSGSQTFGINARPVPQVRFALPEYWNVPGTRQWVGIKGHIAYGKYTDDNWQAGFAAENQRYTEGTLYHSKAGYLRAGNEAKFPLQLELGLEMATQFGGTSYNVNGTLPVVKNESGLKAFWHAFVPGGGDVTDNAVANASGNWVGSWMGSLSWKFPAWKLRAYFDHYFEDHSQMLFFDKDGYVTGPNYATEENSKKYVRYNFKDRLWGMEITLPRNRFVNSVVYEYLYTKYQSGGVYHDHTETISDHVGGIDNYYNHNIYTGWQHWGQAMGNPLYRSPLYNTNGEIIFQNNRFIAHHIGLSGDPLPTLHYRLLVTYQEGWGTYNAPFADKRYNTSVLAEATYTPIRIGIFRLLGWSITGAFALDRGKLLGNNTGCQFTLRKCGLLNF